MSVLAIDIGGTQYRVALVNQYGEIILHSRGKTKKEEGAKWLLPRLLLEVSGLLGTGLSNPLGIGVGFGGPVDFSKQHILASLHAPGWDGVDLRSVFKQEFGLECVIDNDANMGALGEYTYGAGRGYRNILYYTVSTGVGGGIILDGQLFRGVHGQGGELGHLPIQRDGPPCTCGFRGCVESLCSGLSIARQAMEELSKPGVSGLLKEFYGQNGSMTAKDVFECARLGDSTSRQILHRVKDAFAAGLVGAINFFDPEAVIVGGGVGLAPGFLDGLEEWVNGSLVLSGRRDIPIVAGTLGDNSVLLGANALAWSELA